MKPMWRLGGYLFTARKRSLGQGNIFTPVCHSVHRGGVHGCSGGGGQACMVLFGGRGHAWFYLGGMHGFIRGVGACVVLFGGHAWFYLGGVHGFIRGACMVFLGGCVVFLGGWAWFFQGGCAWFFRGACVVFSVFSDTMRYG